MNKVRKNIIIFLAAFFINAAVFNLSNAQDIVRMRHADHPNFTRVVFDFGTNVKYQAFISDAQLNIVFDVKMTVDFGSLKQNPAHYINSPVQKIIDGKLQVTFKLKDFGKLKHFRDGTKIAFDVLDQFSKGQNLSANNTKKINLTSPKIGGNPVSQLEDLSQERLFVSAVNKAGGVVRILYPFRSLKKQLSIVRAAAFMKDKKLWVVFDKGIELDHSLLKSQNLPFLEDVREIEKNGRTIIIYSFKTAKFINMGKHNGEWYIDIKNIFIPVSHDIPVGNQKTKSHGENIFMHVKNVGPVVKVFDPDIGDQLAIIPLEQISYGMKLDYKYPQFSVLQTGQGIVIQLISDDLIVTRYRNGVTVSSEAGLAVSKSKLSSLLSAPMEEPSVTADGKNFYPPLINFTKWKEGALVGRSYNDNRHELLYNLSIAPPENRASIRWDLARFLLANKNPSEAFGVLTVMRDTELNLLENMEYRAVLGVTNIILRRYDRGLELLRHKTLKSNLDAHLWRAVAYDAKDEFFKAFTEFKKGKDILPSYEYHEKAKFLLLAIRSSYMLKKYSEMEKYLKKLKLLPLKIAELNQYDFYSAHLKELKGDAGRAELSYIKLAAIAAQQNDEMGRKLAAESSFILANKLLSKGDKTINETIDKLERLRFAWRGDKFELDLLSRLGELYVENHQYRKGLDTLKIATTYFKKSKKTNELFKLSESLFEKLFLNGGANDMDPVGALGLYSDYQILTPAGAKGEAMARRIADRLVSLDLLNEALQLLNHQIDFRLKGVARADIARRLAMVQIMNGEANNALITLRKTRTSQTPADIQRDRKLIETRALIELQRYEEAEVILNGMTGVGIEALKADILWQSEAWEKLIILSNKALGNRHQSLESLSEKERQTILRLAVAYSANKDKAGLKNLRTRYLDHMNAGRFGDAFDVITADQMNSSTDVRRLTKSIASVGKYETFFGSYKKEFTSQK